MNTSNHIKPCRYSGEAPSQYKLRDGWWVQHTETNNADQRDTPPSQQHHSTSRCRTFCIWHGKGRRD